MIPTDSWAEPLERVSLSNRSSSRFMPIESDRVVLPVRSRNWMCEADETWHRCGLSVSTWPWRMHVAAVTTHCSLQFRTSLVTVRLLNKALSRLAPPVSSTSKYSPPGTSVREAKTRDIRFLENSGEWERISPVGDGPQTIALRSGFRICGPVKGIAAG